MAETRFVAATYRQKTAIHTLKSKLGLSDEQYYNILHDNFKVVSSNDLDFSQAGELITYLSNILNKGKIKPITSKYYGKGARENQKTDNGNQNLTQLQAERIEILQKTMGWEQGKLFEFIETQIHLKKGVQMLTKLEANNVIIGIERIFSWKKRKEYKDINKLTNAELRSLK